MFNLCNTSGPLGEEGITIYKLEEGKIIYTFGIGFEEEPPKNIFKDFIIQTCKTIKNTIK